MKEENLNNKIKIEVATPLGKFQTILDSEILKEGKQVYLIDFTEKKIKPC